MKNKEKKPRSKGFRIAGYVANVALYNNGLINAPGAIKRAVENEKRIAAEKAN